MARTRIDDLAVVVSVDASGLAGELRAAGKRFDDFKKSLDKGSRDTGTGRLLAKEADAHKKAAADISASWRGVGAARAAALGLAGGAGAAAGFLLLKTGALGLMEAFAQLKDSVNLAAEFEMTSVAFEVMLKSGERAKEMLADIRKFAAETPFSLKGVTDSSKMLLGFGFNPSQIIPNVRMLGDVAAGVGKPLDDIVYIYSTLIAQQRAYAVDVRQFAMRGIPIYEELAKVLGVTEDRVKALVEEGLVSGGKVQRAFLNMTGPGGLYHGLTARQAQTFAGAREQLLDAIQIAKTKLGFILIDKLALKSGARDLQEFVGNLEQHLDRVGPFVEFMGDLARSVAQVSYELAKAAMNGSEFLAAFVNAGFPEVTRFLEDLKAFLLSGKEFKLSTRAVNDMVFLLADGLTRLFIDVLKGIKDIGEGFRREIIIPLGAGFQRMLSLWIEAKALVGQATVGERFRPPHPLESDERIMKRYRELEAERNATDARIAELFDIAQNDPDGAKRLIAFQALKEVRLRKDELDAAHKKFLLEGFNVPNPLDPRQVHHKLMGDKAGEGIAPGVPPVKGREDVAFGDAGWFQQGIDALNKRRDEMKKERDRIDQKLLQQEIDDATEMFGKVTAAGAEAAFVLSGLKKPELPELISETTPGVSDAARDANRQYRDPLEEFGEKMNFLKVAFLGGMLDSPDVFKKAALGLAEEYAPRLGMGPTELPDAAMRGTSESVRILNNYQHGGRQTSEDLLREMLAQLRILNMAAERGIRDNNQNRANLAPLP